MKISIPVQRLDTNLFLQKFASTLFNNKKAVYGANTKQTHKRAIAIGQERAREGILGI